MTQNFNDELANRFTIAASELLRHDLEPEFAGDSPSIMFLAGGMLDATSYTEWTNMAKDTQMDLVYLAFAPGRERFGPAGVSVFAERHGIVNTWLECTLWGLKNDGPLLIMPRDTNVCFGHDGLALTTLPSRPCKSLRNGMARAHQRLMRAARRITPEQLMRAEYKFQDAA